MDNILDIDLKNYILIIRKAFTRLIGDEYLDVINERLDRVIFLEYNNYNGIKDYYEYLLTVKKNELMLEFFTSININIEQYKNLDMNSNNYSEFEGLIKMYLGSENGFDFTNLKTGIFSFNYDDAVSIAFQINFINEYLFSSEEIINETNYEAFKNEIVYKRLVENIKKWVSLLEDKRRIYKEYKKSLEPLLNYVNDSIKEYSFIERQNIYAVYDYIEEKCNAKWIRMLKGNCKYKQKRAGILGEVDDYFGFNIFNEKYDNLLKNGSEFEKKSIMIKRLEFFYKIGFIDEEISFLSPNIEEIYNDVMYKNKGHKLIPSSRIRKKLAQLKEELIKKSKYELMMKDYYFNKTMSEERVDTKSTSAIANILIKNPVMVTSADADKKDASLLFFTIRCYDGGGLDYSLIHEFIHLFFRFSKKDNEILSGFDCILSQNKKLNPYDSNYRLYERFNEIITDLFALDVLNVLHNDFKVYLLEEKNLVRNVKDRNTHSILKNILSPFYHTYFDLIIRALMEENLDILFKKIGKDNFEKLVDKINYIDYLIHYFGLANDIDNNSFVSPIYNVYLNNVEEIIDLYEEMKNYKSSKKKIFN